MNSLDDLAMALLGFEASPADDDFDMPRGSHTESEKYFIEKLVTVGRARRNLQAVREEDETPHGRFFQYLRFSCIIRIIEP